MSRNYQFRTMPESLSILVDVMEEIRDSLKVLAEQGSTLDEPGNECLRRGGHSRVDAIGCLDCGMIFPTEQTDADT